MPLTGTGQAAELFELLPFLFAQPRQVDALRSLHGSRGFASLDVAVFLGLFPFEKKHEQRVAVAADRQQFVGGP